MPTRQMVYCDASTEGVFIKEVKLGGIFPDSLFKIDNYHISIFAEKQKRFK